MYRFLRLASWLVLLAMLFGSTPPHAIVAHIASPAAQSQPVPSLPPLVTPPVDTTPSVPVLSVAFDAADDTVAVGDTTTISITVTNRGVVAAPTTSLSVAIPDGINIVSGGKPGQTAVTWDLGTLDAQTSLTRSLVVRATGAVKGTAVLFQPQASAPAALAPATTDGGFVVLQRGLGAAQVVFTPGAGATLASNDGRVSLRVPPGLFKRALTLRHRTLLDARDDLVAHKRPLPPRFVGAHRGFPSFVLDATDTGGADVHLFDAPLTLTVAYTPEELRVLGMRESDLQLYWYDETALTWQALATTVDTVAHTASAALNHFTALTLSDGSSPSAAYLPSLQNWQVSSFTGAASYSYPIDLPGGPGGLAPKLTLSYSSAASDGSGGSRPKWQASWVGKGWSLDGLGYVATNENSGSSGHTWDSFSMVFGGQSIDLVKGKRVDGQVSAAAYADYALDQWNWNAADENFTRVSVLNNSGLYAWRAWSKDGTRYEFDNALRWGENSPTNSYWTYKWLLSKIVDPHGNTIAFDYTIDSIQNTQTIHPTYYLSAIRWGFDGATPGAGTARYKVVFNTADRQTGATAGVDANWEFSTSRVNGESGTPHEKYRLDDILVYSWPANAGGYQLVRGYHLAYAPTANSVQTDVTAGQKVLTLQSIEQRDQNGQTVISAGAPSPEPFKTTFTYGMTQGDAVTPNPGWNRLLTVDNGRGGTLNFAYEHVWLSGATPNNADSYTAYYQNYYRATGVTASDLSGSGKTTLTSYSYGAASNATVNDDAHAATVQYARYAPAGLGDSTAYLTHAVRREFRGHATVTERVYNGATTGAPLLREVQRWFYQGNSGTSGDPTQTCTIPLVSGAVDTSSACFQWMQRVEGWRGRAYKEETRAGATVLARTLHTFARTDLAFFGSDAADAQFSNYYRRAGLWRAFNAETQTEQQTVDGGRTLSHTTKSFYNPTCTADDLASISASYGNVGCTQDYDGSTLVRSTKRWFGATNNADYIVDRQWQESIYNGAGNIVALTNQFYDGAAAADTAPTNGDLTRVARYYDVPGNSPSTTNVTLHGSDTTTGYDAYGNPTAQATYTGASTRLYNGTSTSWSGPSGTARTATTSYDTTFHTFVTQQTNAIGQTTSGGYDYRMGTLTSVTDPNTATTSASYDTFGRLTGLVKPYDSAASPTVLVYSYDTERPFRYLVQTRGSDVSGDTLHETIQFYDGLGRKLQTKRESQGFGAQVIITDMRYDGLNRLVEQGQPFYAAQSATAYWAYTAPGTNLNNVTTSSFDPLGRPTSVTTPGNRTTTTSYGVESGTPRAYAATTDPLGHTTRTRSDALGRRIAVVEPDGATTSYSYNALDQLTGVTDALNNQTSIQYDSLGRKTSMTDPDMGAWNYTYDAAGRLLSQTDAKGQTTNFGYDLLDRLTSKTMPGGWASSYAYDDTTAPNLGKGHRTSMSTALNGVTQTFERWEYDARGRVTFAGQGNPGMGYQHILTSYDSADQITALTYQPVFETVTYSYDAAGRPVSLCSSISGQACYVSNAQYTALDQPASRTGGNGLPQAWSYESDTARLSALQVGATSGPHPYGLFRHSYTYDDADNISTITDPQWPQTQHFSYDTRDRLLHAWTTATLASAAPASNATAARTADLGAALEQRDAPRGAAKPLLRPARGVLAQSTRIKDITFEGGSLTDPTTGADSATAGVTLETSAPLKGTYSATIANNSTGNLTENITAVDELFVSLYIQPASFPASARIVQIQNSGTTVGSISLTSSGTLQLKNGSTTLGTSAALSANALYRIGIHQKKGTGADGVLEAFLAVGDAAFGAAFASSASQTFTSQATKLVVGATNSNAVDATVDDIRLDSAVMPGPSGGGSPTATPTNTPAGPTATPTNTPAGPTATPTNTPAGPTATPTPGSSTRIKDITFEGGSLTDPTTGADSATAGVTLETSAPLKGTYSATIANSSTGNLTENITAVDELFVSLYIRPGSFPASARIVQIQNSGTTVGSISLTSSGTLQLKSGSTTIGTSAALSANTLYRIGLHQKKGTGADGVLEAFLAVGDAAFGAAFASSASQTFTSQASKLVVGATNSNAVDATVDDIRLDSAVMPGPSGGGSPTATPTNTPAGPTATPTNTPTGPTATPTTTPTGPSAPAAYDQSMTYDALGNLLSKTGVGSYAYGANGNGTGAGPHQARTVGGSTYSYDANGNLVSGGGRTYSWRADNLAASVTRAGVTESYTCDGDGTRVAKTVGGVTTVYFQGLWEQVVGGASTQYYTFNGQVVAVRDSAAGVSYLYGDQLGSVSFATNASGSSTSQQDFDAWGAVRSGGISATSLNYTWQRLDSTGLLDYHARLYDPTLARFVSADSVVPGQGITAGPSNPQHLNRYAYVSNNPIKSTDPSGHNEWDGQDRGGGGPPPVESAEELPEYQPAEPSSAEPLEEPLQSPAAQAKGEEAGEGADALEEGEGNADIDDAQSATFDAEQITDYVNSSRHIRTSNKTAQYTRSGGFGQANADFDRLAGSYTIKEQGNGVRSVEFPDGTTISVRPTSKGDYPTVQINSPNSAPIKVRYER